MSCMGSSNACPMGAGSVYWHTKPTEQDILLFPLQFDSSLLHDQPSKLLTSFDWCVRIQLWMFYLVCLFIIITVKAFEVALLIILRF